MKNEATYKVKNVLVGGGYFIYLIIMTMFGTSYMGKWFSIINSNCGTLLIEVIYIVAVVLPVFFITKCLGKIDDVFQIEIHLSIKSILRKVILTILFSFIVICFHFSIKPGSNFVWKNKYIFLLISLIITTGEEEIICRGIFSRLNG